MSINTNKNLFVHIGFGKCGSSKLQKDIFPIIAGIKKYKYWGDEYKTNDPEREKMNRLLLNHVNKTELGLNSDFLEIENNYLISNEELSSYRDAELIEFFAINNLKAFGKDANIILVIREPKNWLSSVFIQLCVHEKPLQKPEDFFLSNKEYSPRLPDQKFNIEKFSYNKIIEVYKKYFDNFSYIKYESLGNMEAISEIFSLEESEKSKLINAYNKNYVNRAVSVIAYKYLWKINSLLSIFNLSFANKYSNRVYLERSNSKFIYNIKKSKPSFLRRSIRNIFNYKTIFQKFIDKIIPYEKFILDFDNLKKIPISKLEQEYRDLPEYKICKKSL
jgi:hypothetical protein